jgi:fibrillarin-like pre-rRNA processing protein
VADIASHGTVYCVEISQRSFRDLVKVCEGRKNMVPILGDATRPEELKFAVESVDIVYQDIAQKNQASIFLKAMRSFGAKSGMLSLKARSEDVTRDPAKLFAESRALLESGGLKVLCMMDLSPFEKDHAMLSVVL